MFRWLSRNTGSGAEERRIISGALADYPPYLPPPWDAASLREASAIYSDFFFENRSRRLHALRLFLAHFNVAVDLDDARILAISAWCPHSTHLLVEGLNTDSVHDAYNDFTSPWIGPLIGLNPIFDLGVYFGECMLSRNPQLKWQPMRGPQSNNVGHLIFGEKDGRPFDPIKWMYVFCCNIYNERTMPVARGAEISTKEDRLYRHILARAVS